MDRDVQCTAYPADAYGDHVQQAWEHWRKLGAPKYLVAPMVDQVCSIRVQCYGAALWCWMYVRVPIPA